MDRNPLLIPYEGEKCIFCGFVFQTQEQMRERKLTWADKGGEFPNLAGPPIACMSCFHEHNGIKET